MHANKFLTIFQEKHVSQHSWKIVRNPFAVLPSGSVKKHCSVYTEPFVWITKPSVNTELLQNQLNGSTAFACIVALQSRGEGP